MAKMILLFAGGIVGFAAMACAQPITPALPDPFAQATAARATAEYARRQKDPLAMLTAARMLDEIPVAQSPVAGTDADSGFSPAALYDEARTLAGGDATLLLQIRIAQSTTPRGVTASPFGRGLLRSVQVMAPRSDYQFAITAKGGERLQIGAIGDLGTSLTMRLSDKAGHVVCLDDHGDYAPVCQLSPQASGEYHVDLVNKSATKSRTVILSN